MKLTKRPDPDGTFAVLDSKGSEVAIGLGEGDADARIASEAGEAGPADGTVQAGTADPAGAKDGGRKGKNARGGGQAAEGKGGKG